eukprot:Rmarinus@m.28363
MMGTPETVTPRAQTSMNARPRTTAIPCMHSAPMGMVAIFARAMPAFTEMVSAALLVQQKLRPPKEVSRRKTALVMWDMLETAILHAQIRTSVFSRRMIATSVLCAPTSMEAFNVLAKLVTTATGLCVSLVPKKVAPLLQAQRTQIALVTWVILEMVIQFAVTWTSVKVATTTVMSLLTAPMYLVALHAAALGTTLAMASTVLMF